MVGLANRDVSPSRQIAHGDGTRTEYAKFVWLHEGRELPEADLAAEPVGGASMVMR